MYIDAPNEPRLLQGMMSQARLTRRAGSAQRPASNDAVFDRQPGPQCPGSGGGGKPDLPG
ncbi:hypothetical protein [Pseudomonas sp.]|uniref:hypothetical protein n=1 Tax=Pseudomonas sp. TaxID=306 RepID=UPI003CC5EC33